MGKLEENKKCESVEKPQAKWTPKLIYCVYHLFLMCHSDPENNNLQNSKYWDI